MAPIILAENIGKKYTIGRQRDGRYVALRDVITDRFRSLTTRRKRNAAEVETGEFWALRNINFELERGGRLGIIGRNGAGKSTLLKILSSITEPTTGKLTLRGRVASLLEVGTGFHPELTGRENIYLNGAILGMNRAEIARKFDEIVEFAGVETFLETPVKRYSSGMYMRLAFAVAAHLEPEILVVDEVLAVGDAEFQRKCLGKMESVGREGRTILFVSHNMGAVQQLCPQSLLLEKGEIIASGPSTEVVSRYLAMGTQVFGEREWASVEEAPGSDVVRLKAVRVIDATGKVRTEFALGEPVNLEIEYWVLSDIRYIDVSFYLTNERGDLLLVTADDSMDVPGGGRPRPRGLHKSVCHIPANFFNDGIVYAQAGLTSEVSVHTIQQSVVMFQMIDTMDTTGARGNVHDGSWPAAAVRPKFRWTIETQAI